MARTNNVRVINFFSLHFFHILASVAKMKIASCLYKFQKIARKANISFDNIYHTLNIIDKPLYDVLEPYRSGWKSFFTLFANILNDTESIFPNMDLVGNSNMASHSGHPSFSTRIQYGTSYHDMFYSFH